MNTDETVSFFDMNTIFVIIELLVFLAIILWFIQKVLPLFLQQAAKILNIGPIQVRSERNLGESFTTLRFTGKVSWWKKLLAYSFAALVTVAVMIVTLAVMLGFNSIFVSP